MRDCDIEVTNVDNTDAAAATSAPKTPMAKTDLEQRFVELRHAVADRDRDGVDRALAAIELAVEGADPLTRAAAYAQIQLERGKPLEAAGVLDDVLAVIGDDARVHHQIGQYRQQGGDLDGALSSFERANQVDPRFAPAWVTRGTLYDRRGDPAAALGCYRNALLAEPNDVGAWRNLGNALAAQAKFDEAASAYDTALGLAVGDRTIAFLRASAHQAKGDLETANRLLPETLRAELGPAIEVRVNDRVCRFHVVSHREAGSRRAAERLLASIEPPEPHAFVRNGDGFVVRHGDDVFVCDADPIHGERPHRFLDASDVIARTSA